MIIKTYTGSVMSWDETRVYYYKDLCERHNYRLEKCGVQILLYNSIVRVEVLPRLTLLILSRTRYTILGKGAGRVSILPLCKRKFFNYALYIFPSHILRTRGPYPTYFRHFLFPLAIINIAPYPGRDVRGNESAKPFGGRNDSRISCQVSASREQITAIASVSWLGSADATASSLSRSLFSPSYDQESALIAQSYVGYIGVGTFTYMPTRKHSAEQSTNRVPNKLPSRRLIVTAITYMYNTSVTI